MAPYRDDLHLLEARAQELRRELRAIGSKTRELEQLRLLEARVHVELADTEERLRRFAQNASRSPRAPRTSAGLAVACVALLVAATGATVAFRPGGDAARPALASIVRGVNLPPETVVVTVRASPPETEVSIDGRRYDNPLIGHLPRGRHVVVAEAPGYLRRTTDLDLQGDAVIDWRLAPATTGSRRIGH